MNTTLRDFETALELGPTFAARLLGVSYVVYAQYHNGRRVLPKYHERHIEALLSLPRCSLTKIIQRHAYGDPATS